MAAVRIITDVIHRRLHRGKRRLADVRHDVRIDLVVQQRQCPGIARHFSADPTSFDPVVDFIEPAVDHVLLGQVHCRCRDDFRTGDDTIAVCISIDIDVLTQCRFVTVNGVCSRGISDGNCYSDVCRIIQANAAAIQRRGIVMDLYTTTDLNSAICSASSLKIDRAAAALGRVVVKFAFADGNRAGYCSQIAAAGMATCKPNCTAVAAGIIIRKSACSINCQALA